MVNTWLIHGYFVDNLWIIIVTRPGKLTVLKMAIEIVDLPSYKMVDLSIVMLSYVSIYQRLELEMGS